MKKLLILFTLCLSFNYLAAQDHETAMKLVNEGVALHDEGEFQQAIAKYENALKADKNYLHALAEMALTYNAMQKYDESIQFCKKAIKLYEGNEQLKSVYVTYGNSLDASNKRKKAIDIYDEGIKVFPDFYQLYFNKGITFTADNNYEEAISCFKKSILLKPDHPGSHNALAQSLQMSGKKVPALLAYGRFITIEPVGRRAKINVENIRKIIGGNVKKTGENSVSINISADLFSDVGKSEDNFSATELILSLGSALDHDEKFKDFTEVKHFERKMESLCSSLRETGKDNTGFYWKYYVPYFLEMKDKDLLKTFSYLVFASTEETYVLEWIRSNKEQVDKFINWSNEYKWPIQ